MVMQLNGCTKDLIDCLSSLGLCEGYRSINRMRKWLAEVDEEAVKKQANTGVCHIIFDNLDLYVKTLHRLTLPLLLFETHPTFDLPRDDYMSLEQTLNLFHFDILNLDAQKNRSEKEHFMEVVSTVLATKIACNVKGLEWIKEHYTEHYNHKYSSTACTRSVLHIEPPIALDEKKNHDMVVLLEQF